MKGSRSIGSAEVVFQSEGVHVCTPSTIIDIHSLCIEVNTSISVSRIRMAGYRYPKVKEDEPLRCFSLDECHGFMELSVRSDSLVQSVT